MQIKPLRDRVVIRRIQEDSTTQGGIIIPDTAAEKPMQGEVVAVGPGRVLDNGTTQSLELQQGQRVLFGKYAGTEVKIKGDDYVVMREDDVMGVIE